MTYSGHAVDGRIKKTENFDGKREEMTWKAKA
jgi:hypothetical protein